MSGARQASFIAPLADRQDYRWQYTVYDGEPPLPGGFCRLLCITKAGSKGKSAASRLKSRHALAAVAPSRGTSWHKRRRGK